MEMETKTPSNGGKQTAECFNTKFFLTTSNIKRENINK